MSAERYLVVLLVAGLLAGVWWFGYRNLRSEEITSFDGASISTFSEGARDDLLKRIDGWVQARGFKPAGPRRFVGNWRHSPPIELTVDGNSAVIHDIGSEYRIRIVHCWKLPPSTPARIEATRKLVAEFDAEVSSWLRSIATERFDWFYLEDGERLMLGTYH